MNKIKKKKINNIIKFPKNLNKLEKQVEAILFAADEPLDIETIEKRVKNTSGIKKILENLMIDYSNRGINLVCIKEKWSFRTSKDLSNLMSLQKSTEKKLSKATLETLSIIVYHQPVTRSEIEEIRGVAFGTNTVEILLELDWIKPAGRKDVLGKPIQYATTENFLHHFNIQKLTDLPTVDELSSAGLIDSATIDASIFGTGKFYKEQSQNKKDDIYSNIEKAIDETPKSD
jgi:segregation and condensation protein B